MKKAILLVAAVFALVCTQARADDTPQYTISFDVTLPAGQADITNVMMIGSDAGGSGITWSFSTGCGGSGCTSTLTNPFPSSDPAYQSLLVGLTNNDQDVVLMTSNAFAASAAGQDWSTLFPNTEPEAAFINDILNATINGDGTSIDTIWAFGTPGSPLNGDGYAANFTVGDSFSVIEFSTGQVIGSGTSYANPLGGSPVPEGGDSFFYVLLGGAALAGFAMLHKRTAAGTLA